MGMGITLKFYVKVLYVIGKALSGEQSCFGTGLVAIYSTMTIIILDVPLSELLCFKLHVCTTLNLLVTHHCIAGQ